MSFTLTSKANSFNDCYVMGIRNVENHVNINGLHACYNYLPVIQFNWSCYMQKHD